MPKKQPEEQTAAFDAEQYDDPELKLDYIDGKPIDEITIRFGGTVKLDRRNREHVELFRKFVLGRRIDFNEMPPLSGVVKQKPNRQVTDKEGTLGNVVQSAVLVVDTIGGFKGANVTSVQEPDGGEEAAE